MTRTCRKCHKDLPLARFEEYKPGKRRWACLTCRYAPYLKGEPPGTKPGRARNGEDIRAETAEGRTCLDCNTWKGKADFRVVDGKLWSYCTECWNKHQKDKYQAEKSQPGYLEARAEQNRRTKEKLKQDVITGYGGKCACCGEAQIEFLTLDHVNNDGKQHREAEGLFTGASSTWTYARKHGYPDIFQLMCFNCNCAKGAYGYCPHQNET